MFIKGACIPRYYKESVMPSKKRQLKIIAVLIIATLLLALCISTYLASQRKELVLATTTSTYDSGLLDAIIPDFEMRYDVEVKIIAVGTGQALRLGERGDADVLLVHAPEKEIEFVKKGYGVYRREVMYNQFIVVGPKSDPADIDRETNVTNAFERIVESRSKFASRGDDSGTHIKEIEIWANAGFSPSKFGDWYLELGQGMGDTLRMANELNAYALTDEATWYALERELDNLRVMVCGDQSLFNQYGVIPVNESLHPNVEGELAKAFADWITSDEVQNMIADYRKDGHQLFTPNA